MLYCENCGAELDRITCRECGLVSEEVELNPRYEYRRRYHIRDENIFTEKSLGLTMELQHPQPSSSSNVELNRALKRQKHTREKNNDYYFMRARMDMRTICSHLRLPGIISAECYNMAKRLIEIKKLFFYHSKGDYRYLACIKTACRLNNVYVDDRELVRISKYYDNKPLNMRENNINRKINKEMMYIKHALKIYIDFPKRPIFISHACRCLNICQEEESKLYDIYRRIYRRFEKKYKLDGYILGLIYSVCTQRKIGLELLEEKFSVARNTIRARKKHVELIMNGKDW